MVRKYSGGEMKDEELLPCPFCGSRANIKRQDGYYIECSNIKCDIKLGAAASKRYFYAGNFISEQEAIEAWNKRVNENTTS